MKRRIVALTLILILLLSMTVHAAQPRAINILPRLEFNGTTAKCTASVIEANAEIVATMALYRGLTRIDYWTDSGTGAVYLSGECKVEDGVEYRLVITGTVDGEAFSSTPIYGTC